MQDELRETKELLATELLTAVKKGNLTIDEILKSAQTVDFLQRKTAEEMIGMALNAGYNGVF